MYCGCVDAFLVGQAAIGPWTLAAGLDTERRTLADIGWWRLLDIERALRWELDVRGRS